MRCQTTLLRHLYPRPSDARDADAAGRVSGAGDAVSHYDWLLADRPGPAGLRTFRTPHPWWQWARRGRIALAALPRHRRRYLDWTGPLTGGRGWVHPAAAGRADMLLETPHRLEIQLRAGDLNLHLSLHRRDAERWWLLARAAGPAGGPAGNAGVAAFGVA
jgi:hypothetical protein